MESAERDIIEVEEYRKKVILFMCFHCKGSRGEVYVVWGALCLPVFKAEMVQWA